MVQKLELHRRNSDFSSNLSVDKEMLICYVKARMIKGPGPKICESQRRQALKIAQKCEHVAQEPEVYFWKISFLAWVMDDTVWFQIVALFGKMFRYSVLFLVFTVFTTIKNFFAISFQTPQKIRPQGPEAQSRIFEWDY